MEKVINKVLAASLLFISIHANVILKSGVVVSVAKVESVFNSLKKLNKISIWQRLKWERLYYSDQLNQYILDALYECSNSLELKIRNDCISQAELLGLCDKNGIMDKEVAEIIKCSMIRKKFNSFKIQFPVSWKTYFAKAYWKSKK